MHRLPTLLFLILITAGAGAESTGGETTNTILQRAISLRGSPYQTGGMAPEGFDCSGFVSYLYHPTLPNLPRTSQDMSSWGQAVPPGAWQPGDLLFYATGKDPQRINHVAIWYGDGYIIHSISDGPETGVVLTPADARYWKQRYISSRRVLSQPASKPPEEKNSRAVQPKDSPSSSWEGLLRGDFEDWKTGEEKTFEAYKEKNG